MGAHQFRLGGTREVQINRARRKRDRRLTALTAQLDQETLEKALADVEDDTQRVAVLSKLLPSLTFTPDPETLVRVAVRVAMRANLERALVDEHALVAAIVDFPPEKRRAARDLLLPLCRWTPSATALAQIEQSLPSGIVTADGQAVEAETPVPTIVLTDV